MASDVNSLLKQMKDLNYEDLTKLISEAENLENEKLVASFEKRQKCMWNNKVYYFCGTVDELDENDNWKTMAVIQEFALSERESRGKTLKYRKVLRKSVSQISPYKKGGK